MLSLDICNYKSAYIENKFLHSQGCDTWYSDLQRLFKIFDNNTGIHNMLKYKHNTFKRKIKVYTKALYQYLKTEVKQSNANANGILPNSLNIAKLVLVLLAPSIYLQK
jgi:hypothetical protein